MEYTLAIIQQRVGGQLIGNPEERIQGVSALDHAQAGYLTFADHDKYAPQVRQTCAAAVIVSNQFPEISGRNLLRVAQPRLAFLQVMHLFQPGAVISAGVHPSAIVSPNATLAEEVTIRECVVIRAGAQVGRGTIIESGVHVGEDVVVGDQCFIGPNVVLMHGVRLGNRVIIQSGSVIGGDGFGYVWANAKHVKIPQLGTVILEDDVELGANVCVDRATLGSTIIKRGTKIDNLVQIAHNDSIGEDVIITGQVGLSGSVTVGNRVMLGGQSGVVDHITIGDDARICAATPVTKDVKSGETVWGFPARPTARVKRELASVALLPKLIQRVRALRLEFGKLQSQVKQLERDRTS